jgi:hypothetical protein
MKRQKSAREEGAVSAANPKEVSELGDLFDGHIDREFADHDVNATMETMVPEPYVHCVPTMSGGFGGPGVRNFYSEHFINQIPKRCEGDAHLPNYRQRPSGRRIYFELHTRHTMGLSAPGCPTHRQAS